MLSRIKREVHQLSDNELEHLICYLLGVKHGRVNSIRRVLHRDSQEAT